MKMKIVIENQDLASFETWSGATETKNTILNAGLADDFERLIDDIFPDGLSDTQLNDILWFESDWIFEQLGITEEEEEEEETI